MFPTGHPELTRPLAQERVAGLRMAAARHRQARPFPARWRPARFVEPAADLTRVVPVPEPAKSGRAA